MNFKVCCDDEFCLIKFSLIRRAVFFYKKNSATPRKKFNDLIKILNRSFLNPGKDLSPLGVTSLQFVWKVSFDSNLIPIEFNFLFLVLYRLEKICWQEFIFSQVVKVDLRGKKRLTCFKNDSGKKRNKDLRGIWNLDSTLFSSFLLYSPITWLSITLF